MIKWISILFAICCFGVSCRQKQTETPLVVPDEESMMEVNRFLVEKDNELIDAFIRRRGWDMKKTDYGYWYAVIRKGQGQQIRKGDVVLVNYRESLLDGTLCYSSEESGPKRLATGRGEVIPGLEEGLSYLHGGDSAVFIIPPSLAYGLPGDGKRIPRRAIIVYELRILEVLH